MTNEVKNNHYKNAFLEQLWLLREANEKYKNIKMKIFKNEMEILKIEKQ